MESVREEGKEKKGIEMGSLFAVHEINGQRETRLWSGQCPLFDTNVEKDKCAQPYQEKDPSRYFVATTLPDENQRNCLLQHPFLVPKKKNDLLSPQPYAKHKQPSCCFCLLRIPLRRKKIVQTVRSPEYFYMILLDGHILLPWTLQDDY